MASLYFIVATITTVGYGDITPGNTPVEQMFDIALMVIGAVAYSTAIGTFMNMMHANDRKVKRQR